MKICLTAIRSPRTPQEKEMVKRACFDCHTNETIWPWYSNMAPVSWFVYRDVSKGREHLNFSEWNVRPSVPEGEGEGEAHQHGPEVIQKVLEWGEMPPAQYLLRHPEARLTNKEIQTLIEKLPVATEQQMMGNTLISL